MRSQFRIWTDRGGKERSLLRIVFPASIDLKKPSHLRIFSNQATRAKTRKTNLIFCGGALGGSVRPESRQWVSRANLAFGAFDGATVNFRAVPTLFDCLAGGAFPPGPIGGIMGYARPSAKDHLRRNARHGRARPLDDLLLLDLLRWVTRPSRPQGPSSCQLVE